MTVNNLIIIGAGGLGVEAIWTADLLNDGFGRAARQPLWKILGYADTDILKHGHCIYGYHVLGELTDVHAQHAGEEIWYLCAIGRNSSRAVMAKAADSLGWRAATLIHPSAIIARHVEIGPGTYVGPGSVLCPRSQIGAHVIINTHVSIAHDVQMGDFAQACPGVRVNGGCHVGTFALLGSNATIMPGVTVGDYAVVGANSLALRSVGEYTSVAGVPARFVCNVDRSIVQYSPKCLERGTCDE